MKSIYVEHSVETCKKLIDEAALIPIQSKQKPHRWSHWDGYLHIENKYESLEKMGYKISATFSFFEPSQWSTEVSFPKWMSDCRNTQGKIYLIPHNKGTKLKWKIGLLTTFPFRYYVGGFFISWVAFSITSYTLFNFFMLSIPILIIGEWIAYMKYRPRMKIFFKNVFEKMGIPKIQP
jgi:hypothetical protein